MSALFNQTNVAPGTSFAAGGGGGGGSNFSLITFDFANGNNVGNNGFNLQQATGTTYNSQAEHVFGFQDINPVLNSGQRWSIHTGDRYVAYTTGVAGQRLAQVNTGGGTVMFDLPGVSTINSGAGAGNNLNIPALVSTLKVVYPGCVG